MNRTCKNSKAKSISTRDDYKHKGMRQQLVKELRSKGISDEKVLNAIANVPRHVFLDKAFEEKMYQDIAFSIEADQTISHPYTVAFQTQLLSVLPGDKVLEVGTGSGYQASVLSYMGAKVYSIERQQSLYENTSKLLPKIGFNNIRTLFGDGYEGAPRFAPFQKIIVTCGATEIPKKLLMQLAIGGKMVIPVGHSNQQKMIVVRREGERKFVKKSYGVFSFVPFLKGTNNLGN